VSDDLLPFAQQHGRRYEQVEELGHVPGPQSLPKKKEEK
jgi:hypothetical protein